MGLSTISQKVLDIPSTGCNSVWQSAMEETPVDRMEGNDVVKHRKSYQFRALSRRAATYHRRHWKLDLCCLGLCPAYIPAPLNWLIESRFLLLGFSVLSPNTFPQVWGQTQTKLSSRMVFYSWRETLRLGVLSCSNIDTQNNPFLFPDQDVTTQYSTVVNGIAMQPVNFHIEPFQIGNVFQSSSLLSWLRQVFLEDLEPRFQSNHSTKQEVTRCSLVYILSQRITIFQLLTTPIPVKTIP